MPILIFLCFVDVVMRRAVVAGVEQDRFPVLAKTSHGRNTAQKMNQQRLIHGHNLSEWETDNFMMKKGNWANYLAESNETRCSPLCYTPE